MSDRVPKPLRQLAALALVAALGAVLWLHVWMPFQTMAADQEKRIAEQREVLGRLLSAGQLEQQAQAFSEKSKAFDTKKLLLKGDSDPLRTSELRTTVAAIADAEGIRLKSSTGLPAREQNSTRLIGLQVQFQATLEQLQKVIIAIESSETILVIDALRIAAGPGAADPKSNAPLDVSIEISGATGAAKG